MQDIACIIAEMRINRKAEWRLFMILTVTLNPTVDKSYYVDKLLPGEVNRIREFTETPGGKGIQVAKVANLLGQQVRATGFLGGRTGNYINSFLENAGIETSFVAVDDETRTCVNVNDASTGRQTELLEPGAKITQEKQQEFLKHYEELLKDCDIVAISGSVPAGIDENYYPQLIALAKQTGKKVVLDTSGSLLRAGIKALPHIIKPNRDEIMELIGREIKTKEEVIAAASEIRAGGIETVIVSLGKDGAIFVTGDGVYQGVTPSIKIVNTVACGDSLVAGFATGFCRGMSMTDTIKLAMAVSTANALRRETGFFIQEDLDRLLTMVDAVKLK
jgi:tagatose 6-phosphate kinase